MVNPKIFVFCMAIKILLIGGCIGFLIGAVIYNQPTDPSIQDTIDRVELIQKELEYLEKERKALAEERSMIGVTVI